tara:strand:+ start:27532 stop:27828 length:297 start_codon:yes stop_codon:yes gene_type:complete
MLKIVAVSSLLAISVNSGAATLEAKNCPVTDGKVMKKTALKLRLSEQGYRIINVALDESTHCFHLYGFNPKKLRIKARFNPYSGELVYEERVKKREIK